MLTGIAVEVREPKGIGRCRMAVLADGSAESLHPFITRAVELGARVITDGWNGYIGLDGLGYTHERRSQRAARARGDDPGELLPAVHRVASLAKRWLLGTHQGSVEEAHLPAYLNEFVFRFNRRNSRSRGMLFYRVMELAAGHEPIRYADILASRKPRTDISGRTNTPPLNAAIGVLRWSGSMSIDIPRGGRPLVMAKRIPACLSFATAAMARSVRRPCPGSPACRRHRRGTIEWAGEP